MSHPAKAVRLGKTQVKTTSNRRTAQAPYIWQGREVAEPSDPGSTAWQVPEHLPNTWRDSAKVLRLENCCKTLERHTRHIRMEMLVMLGARKQCPVWETSAEGKGDHCWDSLRISAGNHLTFSPLTSAQKGTSC